MKYISYTLHGNKWDSMYVCGAFANAKEVKEFYPDWKMVVFHDKNVTDEIIDKLQSMDVMTVNIHGNGILSAGWRFLAYDLDDCEAMICRDLDSRITKREVAAVAEWEDEGKPLHIMRDHPLHVAPILGGMWGFKKNNRLENMEAAILNYQKTKFNPHQCCHKRTWWQKDQLFLSNRIYSVFGNRKDSTIHVARDLSRNPRRLHETGLLEWYGSYFRFRENWSKDFSTPLEDNEYYIGEKLYGAPQESVNWTGDRFPYYKTR